mgnify:FL=1
MQFPSINAHLADFFITFASIEAQIEYHRVKTAQFDDFEPYSSFKRMDQQNLGYITVIELSGYLQNHGIMLSETELASFIEFFGPDTDQRLTYANFLGAVLPTTNLVLRQVAARRHTYLEPTRKFLEADIDQRLAALLEIEISLYYKIHSLNQSLVARPDWDVYKAYCLIDSEKAGSIDRFCLLKFLKKNTNIALSFEDLLPLFRRIDVDNDGKLSYPEFQAIFTKKSHQNPSPIATPLKKITFCPLKRIISNGNSPMTADTFDKYFSSTNETAFEKSFEDPQRSSNWKPSGPGLYDDLHQLVEGALKKSQETRAKNYTRQEVSHYVNKTQLVVQPLTTAATIPHSSPKRKAKLHYASPVCIQSNTKDAYQSNQHSYLNETLPITINKNNTLDFSFDGSPYPKPFYNSDTKNYLSDVYDHSIEIPANPAIPDVSKFNERTDYIQLIPSRGYATRTGTGCIRGNFESNKINTFQNEETGLQISTNQPFREHGHYRSKSFEQPHRTFSQPLVLIEQNPNESMKISQPNQRAPGRFRHQRHETMLTNNDSYLISQSQQQQKPGEAEFTQELKCIAEALKDIAEATQQVDAIRNVLAYQSDFTISAACKALLLAPSETNNCSLLEFRSMLEKWGIKIEDYQIKTVFERFDVDNDGILSASDLEKLFIPRNADAAEVLEGRKCNGVHKKETYNWIGQLLSVAVKTEVELENTRKRLRNVPNSKLEAAFRSLDPRASGNASTEEINKLIERYFGQLKKSTLESLFMRYNLVENDRIPLKELIRDLVPKTFE